MKKKCKSSKWSGKIASNLKKMIIKKGFIMSEKNLENAVTSLATCGDYVVIGSKGGTLKVFEILPDKKIKPSNKKNKKIRVFRHDFNPCLQSENGEISLPYLESSGKKLPTVVESKTSLTNNYIGGFST